MKPFYYIYRSDETRGPKVKHPTLKQALAEAERLANQHPGGTFEILKAVAITRCTTANTFWMDGSEPPSEAQQYRVLGLSEIVVGGDEFWNEPGKCWCPFNDSVGLALNQTDWNIARRPIQ